MSTFNKDLYGTYECYAEITSTKPYRRAMDKLITNKYYEMLSLQNDLNLLPQLQLVNKGIKMLKELKQSKKGTLWLWLTVNPKPKTDPLKFFSLLHKFANRKMFTEYYYVIEQRGTTEETIGKGFHSHLLLKRHLNYKPSIVIKNSKNTFKHMTRVDNDEVFFHKWCPQDYLADKLIYMTENKGEEKSLKQKYDIPFRKKYSLKNLYQSIAL